MDSAGALNPYWPESLEGLELDMSCASHTLTSCALQGPFRSISAKNSSSDPTPVPAVVELINQEAEVGKWKVPPYYLHPKAGRQAVTIKTSNNTIATIS